MGSYVATIDTAFLPPNANELLMMFFNGNPEKTFPSNDLTPEQSETNSFQKSFKLQSNGLATPTPVTTTRSDFPLKFSISSNTKNANSIVSIYKRAINFLKF